MKNKKIKIRELEDIIKNKRIYPVFQPIVDLRSGHIFAYEALSRVLGGSSMKIGELFELACRCRKVWELEAVCRRNALKQAVYMPAGKKLFLNVDPNVILDPKFRSGTTRYMMKKYGLTPDDVVFEVTERTRIKKETTFTETVNHYRDEEFHIAIDDFGAEFAGMNRVCMLHPEYIKLDIELIKDIDSNEYQRSFVKHFADFCEENGIKLVAEGIETKAELETAARIGVAYGQGYYLYAPGVHFVE